MSHHPIENIHVFAEEPIISPSELKARLPLTPMASQTVFLGHQTIKNILDRKDSRLFAVVGPCSIHDTASALEYAGRLKALADELDDSLFIVMRVYFEKPRTTLGWQGLVSDPHLDGSCDVPAGLSMARQLLLDIASMGLCAAGEALDLVTPQYIQDLISWTAIGARTTESQTHRKMASGFSSPVGFKNGTDGNVMVAVSAMKAAASPNNFISVNPAGQVSVVRTKGNPYTHVVLRGGLAGPNYDRAHVAECERLLLENNLKANIMIDASHANARKDPQRQKDVVRDVISQIRDGNRSIAGVMVESHLFEGNQPLAGKKPLRYGVSITDPCLGWEATEALLRELRTR